jgi:hypothetical protein
MTPIERQKAMAMAQAATLALTALRQLAEAGETLDQVILLLPTGPGRNKVTDANIHTKNAIMALTDAFK